MQMAERVSDDFYFFICYSGFCMSACVLLNLLNKLGDKISVYRFSPTSLINSVKHEHESNILFIICHQNHIQFVIFTLKC